MRTNRTEWAIVLVLAAVLGIATGCGLLNGAFKVDPATSSTSRTTETAVPPTSARLTTAEVTTPAPTPIIIRLPEITIQGGGRAYIVAAETPVTPGSTRKETQTAEGKGVGVTVPAGKDVGGLDLKPPASGIGDAGPSATGGGLGVVGLVQKALGGAGILYLLGALAVVAGGAIAGLLKQFLLGGGIAGGGAALIGLAFGLERYPWLILVLMLLFVLAAIWFVFHARNVGATVQKADALQETGIVLATAIEGLKEEGAKLKAEIESIAAQRGTYETVKATVSGIKAQEGLVGQATGG
jgi:cell division protein FtsB